MKFENIPPQWDAQGAEPTTELKTKGFLAGYKPPAAYFNWLFNRITACLKELQTVLGGHADNKSNPHGVTVAQIGAANNELSNINKAATATGNLIYRGIIDINHLVDANTLTSIGIYKVYIDPNVAAAGDYNFPTPYGTLFVIASMDGVPYDYVSQLFCAVGNDKIIVRNSSDKGSSWGNWVVQSNKTELEAHANNKSNPHGVTAAQIGAVATAKILGANADLNTVTTSGMYRIDESPVNAPDGSEYSQLLVIAGGGDTVSQIVIHYNTSSMFVRSGNPKSTGGTWRDWKRVVTLSDVVNNLTSTATNLPLSAAQGKALNDAINTVKTNFQDGCSTIAAAITSKGVSTANNASPATMAANIKNIKTNAVITSKDNYLQGGAGVTISMTKGIIVCYWANGGDYAFYVLQKDGTNVSVKTNYNRTTEWVFSHSNVTANSIYIKNILNGYSHVYQYVITP